MLRRLFGGRAKEETPVAQSPAAAVESKPVAMTQHQQAAALTLNLQDWRLGSKGYTPTLFLYADDMSSHARKALQLSAGIFGLEFEERTRSSNGKHVIEFTGTQCAALIKVIGVDRCKEAEHAHYEDLIKERVWDFGFKHMTAPVLFTSVTDDGDEENLISMLDALGIKAEGRTRTNGQRIVETTGVTILSLNTIIKHPEMTAQFDTPAAPRNSGGQTGMGYKL